jgi:hypothetical protein
MALIGLFRPNPRIACPWAFGAGARRCPDHGVQGEFRPLKQVEARQFEPVVTGLHLREEWRRYRNVDGEEPPPV